MSLSDDPWELPSAQAFLAEIEGAVSTGGALVMGGPSMPPNLVGAITRYFRDRFPVEIVESCPDRQPAEMLGDVLGVTAEAGVLARATHLDHLVVVTSSEERSADMNKWRVFLSRFLKVRTGQTEGPAILVLAIDGTGVDGIPLVAWNGRLKRIDVTIWADLHIPPNRPEPLAALSLALAIELCVWRLDLAAEIARARREDILNPMGWLQCRVDLAVSVPCRLNGQETFCPIALLEQKKEEDVNHRIWRAQLAALFPWIEMRRQKVVSTYRKCLRLDEHLKALGVQDVSEIEFGALAKQLRSLMPRTDAEIVDCLARLRNRLAHGKRVDPTDLDYALRETGSWERLWEGTVHAKH
ncbi:MAG: hypothetical protein HQL90_07460 [Magnetococcales bacterium]|nr:hypothetical protein [Magnetococcales bacterium]